MCNACGFQCCAYDGFSGCGCDGCDEPECWSDDAEFFGSDDDDDGPAFDDSALDQVQGRSSLTRRIETPTNSSQSVRVSGGRIDMADTPFANIAKRQFPAIRSTATRSPKDRHDLSGATHACCAPAPDNGAGA